MDKMVSLMGRGKWVVWIAALVACGSSVTNVYEVAGSGSADDAGAAGSEPVGGAGPIVVLATHEAGQGGALAADDGGSAGDVEAGAAGALSIGGVGGYGGSVAKGGAPSGGQPSGGIDQGGQSTGGSGVAGQSGAAGASPTCQCTTGECCDGCHVQPNTYRVGVHEAHTTQCVGEAPRVRIAWQFGDRYCDGASSGVGTRWVDTNYSSVDCRLVFSGDGVSHGGDFCHAPIGVTPYCGP